MAVECRIVHCIRGRVRLRVQSAELWEQCSPELQGFLSGRPGVESVRLNRRCQSVTIEFDAETIPGERFAAIIAQLDVDDLVESPTSPPERPTLVWRSPPPTSRMIDAAGRAVSFLAKGMRSALHSSKRLDSTSQRGSTRTDGCLVPENTTHAWHAMSEERTLGHWRSSRVAGLPAKIAEQRLEEFGPNRLATIQPRSRWSIFASQFMSLPVGLLVGSAVVSLATGGVVDAVVILSVVLINACIGDVTEQRAEHTIASLFADQNPPVLVTRGRRRRVIPSERIVPGDVISLAPGCAVPADVRLIEVERLMVDESALTGESMPVTKHTSRINKRSVALRNRMNMVYRGTSITGGSGIGCVVEVGSNTEAGKIQQLAGSARPPETPVQRQLRMMGTQLGLITGGICAGVFGIGLVRGHGLVPMLKIATALGVAAVPEGLPMIATTTLALGVNRMRRRRVLVRRLDAVETLGAVRVFCLDKTGTITENRMRVTSLFLGTHCLAVDNAGIFTADGCAASASDLELSRLLRTCVLCNEADVTNDLNGRGCSGSPTEKALLELAISMGVKVTCLRKKFPLLKTQYRTEARGFMTTLHATATGGRLLAVKGRPADVLDLCSLRISRGRACPLSEGERAVIRTENERMAGKALRVLGLAYQEGEHVPRATDANLVWLGLVGIADPIRPGMSELIQKFHAAGIRTIMITGDQSATAYAIGRELNISGEDRLDMIDSTELEQIDPEVLKGLVQNVDVFSAVTPSHKLQIVQALQSSGFVVAMTGDGINDGPALRAADIGVAMGGQGGSDVARMTADVVLEDNNLDTMVTAIGQGRTIYANTRNAIRYVLTTNMSEILVVSASVAGGIGTPLNPMQLLWINLISDIFPVLALAVQPPPPDVLRHDPRDPSEPFLQPRDVKRMAIESSIISAGTFASYGWGVYRYGPGPRASTLAFMSITAAQLFHMLGARSENLSVFSRQRVPTNRLVWLALFGGLGLQLLTAAFPPLRRLLRNAPLSLVDHVVAFSGAAVPFAVNEALKELPSLADSRSLIFSLDQDREPRSPSP